MVTVDQKQSSTHAVVAVSHLSKTYASRSAVNDVTFSLVPGEIVGFLGTNGAGKTTTIRMMLGLVRPSGGTIRVFGEPLRPGSSPSKRVGALVDRPALHPHLAPAETLEYVGCLAGLHPDMVRNAVPGLLTEVGLDGASALPVSAFSTGMRQRLALAAAFLGDPELILLDEPTDGLDPEAIVMVRRLVRRRAAEGATIFLSSHLLGEVEATATRVLILDHGKIVADTTPEALGGQLLNVRLNSPAQAIAAYGTLSKSGTVKDLAVRDCWVEIGDAVDGSLVVEVLTNAKLYPSEVRVERRSLEQAFLQLTGSRQVP